MKIYSFSFMITLAMSVALPVQAVAQGQYFQAWTGGTVDDVMGWRNVVGGATVSNPASGGNTGGSDDGYLAWTTNDSGKAGASPTDGSTNVSTDANLNGNLWTKYGSDLFVSFDLKVDGAQEITHYDLITSSTSGWGTWTKSVTLSTPQTAADGWVTHKHRLAQSWDDTTAAANGWENGMVWETATDFSSFMETTNYLQLEVYHGNAQATGGVDNFGFEAGNGETATATSTPAQQKLTFRACRRCLVSSKINPPDPFPGYANFLGWEDVIRLQNGDMLVGFCAGYWHVSFKTPVMLPPHLKKSYIKGGFRDIDAPRGGRIMYIRSSDDGLTWSKPKTLIDTEWDDQEPSMVQLPDGTLVHTFMVLRDWYGFPETPPGKKINSQGGSVRSLDNGQTWEREEAVHWIETPLKYTDRNSAPAVVLPNGDLLLATCGSDSWGNSPKFKGPVYRSQDKGATWKLVSVIDDAPTAIDEPSIVCLPSGRVVMITRPDGAVLMSDDEGKTWPKRVKTGVKMCAPHLVLQRDGTLVCVYGPGPPGALQAIFSNDGGETWVTAGPGNEDGSRVGFTIDSTVYGYPGACELPDGSIYCVYFDAASNQQDTGVWAIRFRVTADKKGIELLPVPGASGYDARLHGLGPQRAPNPKSVNIDALGK